MKRAQIRISIERFQAIFGLGRDVIPYHVATDIDGSIVVSIAGDSLPVGETCPLAIPQTLNDWRSG